MGFFQRIFHNGLAFGLILFFALATCSFAQVEAEGTPPSFALSTAPAVGVITMLPIDVEAYLEEAEQAGKDEPYAFGAPIEVSYNLGNSGEWTSLSDGSRIWRLRIVSEGAYSINLLYNEFYMPEDAELYLYNDYDDERRRVIGAFTSYNNKEDGTFTTAPVAGDAITLEYYEPAAVIGQGVISIWRVVHAYRNVFGFADDPLLGYGDSGWCNNNVNCPEGAPWQSDKRGVAMIIDGGWRLCTGSLINNINQDGTPYFLTANHCLGGEEFWTFMFNYESPGCANEDGPTTQTVSNATLRADLSASDFALLEISGDSIPSAYNPYFNGWNRGSGAASNTVCIHHPSGDIKKITFDDDAPVSSGYFSSGSDHWKIIGWEDGTTEGGSSGSPLFDQNHRIVGQLHGGYASCDYNYEDYYGKFYTSWESGDSPRSRLRDWLDPGNTVTVLDGYDPSIEPSITVTYPIGGETWFTDTYEDITWTSQDVTGNVKIELDRSYPSSWETLYASTANDGVQSWFVTSPVTSDARIRISSINEPSAVDVSDGDFTIVATSADPPEVVILPSGSDAQLHWSSTGSSYYRIYSDTTPFGAFSTLEGSTSDTAFTDPNAITDGSKKFYRVLSSTLP